MKLKNLFYLLLALPLLAVGCSKEPNQKPSDGPDEEFFMEETLILGERYGLSEGKIDLLFKSEKGDKYLDISVATTNWDGVLKAGTYSVADDNLLLYTSFLAITTDGMEFINFEGGDGTFVVEGDVNGYKIDCLLTDAENRKYHFTYDGKIKGISPNGDLPTEPVNMEAKHFSGAVMDLGGYTYILTLSDKGYGSTGLSLADGNYYDVWISGIKGEVDADGYMIIPAGTYTFDETSSFAEWTINKSMSTYTKISEDGSEYYAETLFEDATLVVNEDSLVLTATIDGVEHTVTHNGVPKVLAGQ